MLTAAINTPWRGLLLFIAGVAAGVSNGVAGGGTFISFPTLLALGIPPIQANVSSSVGLVPSVLAGVRVFRSELTTHKFTLRRLVPVCVAGSGVGTALLLTGSAHDFRSVVPWLIGAATVLFALAPRVTRVIARRYPAGHEARVHPRALSAGVFVASVYGGYFGAGLGIVLLAVLALTLPADILTLQGMRIALGLLTNTVAALVFVIRGHLALVAVAILLVSTFFGGWLGAHLLRRLSPALVRSVVIVIGTATTVRLLTS
ncbi:MAG TPA: sulfite exporter TauE/SafE family protein [Acidimicrobiales bacterium]|nr:sulfite exporter TauE/SafE family protein [Acidimicrobiales bacterium]